MSRLLHLYPDEWQLMRLESLVEIITSNVDKKSKEGQKSVLLCNYMDVFNNKYIHSGLKFMPSTASDNEITKFSLRMSDVIITKDSETPEEIAEPSVVVEKLNNVVCGYHLTILRPKRNIIWGQFLRDIILSEDVRHQFVKSANGITRFGLTIPSISGIQIPLPPLAEQKAIAQILGTWDEAIQVTEALIDALGRRKQGLMQGLLTGEVRFPEFEGEWGLSKLGEHAHIRRGASPRPIKDPKWFAETGRGWIRIADINASSSRFLDETTQYLSNLGIEKSVKVEVGELILSIAATIGVPKIVNIPACIHDGFVLIKEYEDLDTEFLYHYLSFQTEKIARGGQPGTQKNINSEIVRLIDVPDISLNEQQRIAEFLNDCDAEINQLIAVTEELQEQKRGLMQVLLTGQVRAGV